MWQYFLKHPMAFCRPFIDFEESTSAVWIPFYTDASRAQHLGCGGWFRHQWFSTQWQPGFIQKFEPSIAYLELFAVVVGCKLWLKSLKNRRVIIHCDNQVAVQMINNSSSYCKNCMVLIRMLVLECLIQNVRVFAQYVQMDKNAIADALSRLQYDRFRSLTTSMDMEDYSQEIPESLWPIHKIWKS